ncbi:MAG: 2-succinyl-6-hydroxy-2,4-cyclohexadiene-1-carboxylate synthase [Chloroflexi bacterium]|nr:2-succinyl-6-hydroxy-2,4-cyclohexadiene-1-carboxylate synthase [Chloroflexota bacterium]
MDTKHEIWSFETLGDRDSPALLFLHGFMGRGGNWQRIAERFADSYYCVLPDLPGHGHNTGLSPGYRFTYDGLTRGLETLLGKLGIPEPVLVGYSLGGRLALSFCLDRPYSARALVLESASPGIEAQPERVRRAALDDQRADRILSEGMGTFLDTWYQAPLFTPLAARPDLLKQVIAENGRNVPAWMAQAIRELSPGRVPSFWKFLPNIQIPTLLLAGEHDGAYMDTLTTASRLIPKAEFRVIPGSGHNIHLEQPEAFADALEDFLSSLIPTTPPA